MSFRLIYHYWSIQPVKHKLTRFAAWPVADEALSQQLLDLVQSAGHYRQIKKGANGSYTSFIFRVKSNKIMQRPPRP